VFARRDVLRFGALGGMAAAAATLPSRGVCQQFYEIGGAPGSSLAPRRIAIHNLHTDEAVEAVYFEDGAYVPDALAAFNHVLRDFRSGDVFHMDTRLFDLMHTLQATVESTRPFQIISGYRSPKTNEMLHENTSGVATNSYHMRGMASDIRLPDVELAQLHRAALMLKRGGVGYYPTSDFVHVDVGPSRHWG
jgi:uncharacterized protein YcbK (DUF882 family)